jgi:streptogramin lyase
MTRTYSLFIYCRLIITAFILLVTHTLPAQMITTIAGGSIGEGKPATSIGMTVFWHLAPYNVLAVDTADNLYIVDNKTIRIRKITASTGIITTVAGNGNTNFSGDGQPAINAGLGSVFAITVDRLGNIYLGSVGRIRKINAVTGIIHTIAGTGASGFSGDGAPATQAQVAVPRSITLDTAGNIYFTDQSRIRKITAATGIITTIAGNGTQGYTGDGGPATLALLAAPRSITSDAAGNLYWVDNNNNAIRKITAATGIITTVVGTGITGSGFSGDGGPAAAAKISFPTQVVADSVGNLYLSDNNRIRKIDITTGIINTIAGTAWGGYTPDGVNALMAGFSIAGDLAISRSGNLYLREENNALIRKIAATTNLLSTVYGNRTKGTSNIGGPVSQAQLYLVNHAVDRHNNIYFSDFYNGKIYLLDMATHTISKVAGTGIEGTNQGDGGLATAANLSPGSIAIDSIGNFYFTENGKAIRKVSIATGIITTIAGTGVGGYSGDGGPATAAQFDGAFGLTFDKAGNLYFADFSYNVVRKISATTGIISTIAGNGTRGFSGDGGLATAATMNNPFGVTVDRSGNVYISDAINNAIRRVDAITGIITTVAGTGAVGYSGDGGPATNAMLNFPYGLATDTAGNVFIADRFNHRVRKITVATGNITTVAGLDFGGYNGDSIPATTAALLEPISLCMDTAGNLLIADNTYRIRKIIYDTIPVNNNPPPPGPPPVIDSNVIVTKAYPNPAHGSVTITLKGLISGNIAVTVTDLYGKPIATEQVAIQPTTDYTITLPLPITLQKGLYYVRIFVNNKKQVHLLMIE